jgi:hypothetical protein
MIGSAFYCVCMNQARCAVPLESPVSSQIPHQDCPWPHWPNLSGICGRLPAGCPTEALALGLALRRPPHSRCRGLTAGGSKIANRPFRRPVSTFWDAQAGATVSRVEHPSEMGLKTELAEKDRISGIGENTDREHQQWHAPKTRTASQAARLKAWPVFQLPQ